MWGARSDVSFALQTLALKALPVLILGGFTSIPGAIVGGIIIGVGEKLGRILAGAPLLGSRHRRAWLRLHGIARWCSCCSGRRALFGETHHRSGSEETVMFYRETGQYKTSYAADTGAVSDPAGPHRHRAHPADHRLRRYPVDRCRASRCRAVMIPILIFSLAAIGLNLLTGYTGLNLARHRRLHGCGRLCLLLSSPPSFPGANIIVLILASGFVAAAVGAGVRPAVAAHQGLLSDGGDAGGAVLPVMVLRAACRGWSITTSPMRSRCRRAPSSTFR